MVAVQYFCHCRRVTSVNVNEDVHSACKQNVWLGKYVKIIITITYEIKLTSQLSRWRHRRWWWYTCSGCFLEQLGKYNDNQTLLLLFAVTYLLSWCWFGFHVPAGYWVVGWPSLYHLVAAIVIDTCWIYTLLFKGWLLFLIIYIGIMFRSRLFIIVHDCR